MSDHNVGVLLALVVSLLNAFWSNRQHRRLKKIEKSCFFPACGHTCAEDAQKGKGKRHEVRRSAPD